MPDDKTTTANADNWKNKELGALWKREKQSSKEKYLTGTLNLKVLGFDKDIPLVIFSNKRKTTDAHPDLRIYLSEKQAGTRSTAKPATAPVAAEPAAAPASNNELI